MLGLAASLPDPLVGLLPDLGRALRLALDDRPQAPRQSLAAARVEEDGVQHGTEDVVLALVEGAVADAHRLRARVAGELVARGLGQVAAPVDPVHDLQRAVLVGLEIGDELHELVRLPVEVEVVQRLQREGGVAHPREPVVPVALPARGLRQRGGQRGDGGPGGHVRQALDGQRRAFDRLAPAMVDATRPVQPGAPVARGSGEPAVGLVDVLRRRELLSPRQRAVDLVALVEGVSGSDPVALDAERHVGLQPDRLGWRLVASAWWSLPSTQSGSSPACVRSRRPGRHTQLDVDAAREAKDCVNEHVVGVVVVGGRACGVDLGRVAARADGQRVTDQDRPRSARATSLVEGRSRPARRPATSER